MDPAVHITNASHCGGDHVFYPGYIHAQAATAVEQLLLQRTVQHYTPPSLLSSHVQHLSTLIFSSFNITIPLLVIYDIIT